MKNGKIGSDPFYVFASPVLHDNVGVLPVFTPGRQLKYLNDRDRVAQTAWTGFGMDYETSQNYFDDRYVSTCGSGRNRRECKGMDHQDDRTLVGVVDPDIEYNYSEWLEDNYNLDIEIKIDPRKFNSDGTPKAWNEE